MLKSSMFRVILVLIVLFVVITPLYSADDGIRRFVDEFLAFQSDDREHAFEYGFGIDDVNGDHKGELVLVWAKYAPTSWQFYITVFGNTNKGIQLMSHAELVGEAEFNDIRGGIVYVNQVVYAKGDGRCCPSIKKQFKYKLVGKQIVMLK